MGTFAKAATIAGGGATAGTFGAVGTIQLRNDAQRVLGIYCLAGGTSGTTTEAEGVMLEVKSDDWDVGTNYFQLGGVCQHGVGTNSENPPVVCGFVPLNIPVKGGARIVVGLSTLNSCTGGYDGVVSILYDNGGVPQEALTAIWNWGELWASGSRIQILADGKAAARKQYSTWPATSMTIPGAKAIVGFKAWAINDASPTADESCIGYIDFDTTIADFQPQEYPNFVGTSAGDGTVPMYGDHPIPIKTYPCWIPLKGKNETIDAYGYMVVASTGAVAVGAAVLFRK